MTARVHVAVIGAGASGTLTAVQYARVANDGRECALIEAGARAARGLAYGTPYGAHLLNVPAARMSAFPDDPAHFHRWLTAREPDAPAGMFAPRLLYGEYLASLLEEPSVAERVRRVGGTAVGLTREDGDWNVHLQQGRIVRARAVVLALGNLPPAEPFRFEHDASAAWIRDPWAPGVTIGLPPESDVLLIGTGLTMVDLALALRHEGHRGTIHALSRNGRVPQPHATVEPRPLASMPPQLSTPRGALRWVKREVAAGAPWRSVIDSLRPHTGTIWRSWSLPQRGSFVRHARNLWDVHRHRAAPHIYDDLSVEVLRGRVTGMRNAGEATEVTWRPTGSDETRTLRVSRVINCTGPASDYARVDFPLAVQLRHAGWLVPDRLALGIETDDDGALRDRNGHRVENLFTLGPLRRPALWESTAIPEIREQASALAQLLASIE